MGFPKDEVLFLIPFFLKTRFGWLGVGVWSLEETTHTQPIFGWIWIWNSARVGSMIGVCISMSRLEESQGRSLGSGRGHLGSNQWNNW